MTSYPLVHKTIHYLSGISAKRTDDGVAVELLNIDVGKTVILALYDGDKLVEVQRSSEYGENGGKIMAKTAVKLFLRRQNLYARKGHGLGKPEHPFARVRRQNRKIIDK